VILSDTVGFIAKLPHHLVDAFRATLEELEYADLLLHVIDASDPHLEQHIAVVDKLISQLAKPETPVLKCYNKADLVYSDDIPVAIADLMNFDPHHLRAEVGIMVLAPYRNCGIATETLSTLDVYARHTLLIHTLYAIAAEGNVASQKLFEKAGYTCVAALPDWLATERGYLNAMLFAKTIEKQC